MTPAFKRSTLHMITEGEIGHRYPGPVPFTPTGVTAATATLRAVWMCVVDDGYSLNPKTGQPYARRHVQAIAGAASLINGKWLVSRFDGATFSCAHVTVPEPSWSTS
jgi:hypothetical protein